jgi:hypothetical protein
MPICGTKICKSNQLMNKKVSNDPKIGSLSKTMEYSKVNYPYEFREEP